MRTSEMPTATVREHRLRIFDATRRPTAVSAQVIRTRHGIIERTGKLGQAHADLLDAICYCAEKRAEMKDGRIKLLVDPARVRKTANINSGQQFKKLVKELVAAVIEIKAPDNVACVGHLVDHIDTARRADGTPLSRRNPLGGERELWRVELGKALCRLLEKDVWRGYDPGPLARLESGIAQAVARHVLTHKQAPAGGWHLDTLIAAVAGDLTPQAVWDRRRELRAEAGRLHDLGVGINDGRVQLLLRAGASARWPGANAR